MAKILGLSGSLRTGSFNTGLLEAAVTLVPEGTELQVGSIADVPLYNGDIDTDVNIPASVLRLREQLREADGLLMVTPEYNNGIPGVFKNAIDWMGSGHGAKAFADKPVAVIGASPGGFGSILAQNHWHPVLRALKTRPYFGGRLMVSGARKLFDETGTLTDEATKEKLAEFMGGFVASITSH